MRRNWSLNFVFAVAFRDYLDGNRLTVFEGQSPISCSELRENSTNGDLMKKGNQSIPNALKESNKIVSAFSDFFSVCFIFGKGKMFDAVPRSLLVFGVDDWMNDTHTHTHTLAPPPAPLHPSFYCFSLEWSRTFYWFVDLLDVILLKCVPSPAPSPSEEEQDNQWQEKWRNIF